VAVTGVSTLLTLRNVETCARARVMSRLTKVVVLPLEVASGTMPA
jgi:hypothetical protein